MYRRTWMLCVLIALLLAVAGMAGCAPAPAAEMPEEAEELEQVDVKPEVAMSTEEEESEDDLWYTAEDLANPWTNVCTETPPQYGGSVTLAFSDSALRGQNWLARSSTNEGFVFSQLVDLEMDAQTIAPDVAHSWDISDDGLIVTYHLRDDVLWHDGEQLMADDVKWTIEMFWHPDTGIPTRTTLPLFAIAGVDEFASGEADEIAGVKVLDDYTVEITLSSPRADFFYGMGGLNLFPKHIWEGMEFADMQSSDLAREGIIGSGPFRMGEFVPDQFYILEAFEDYYRGRPYLDRLIFRIGLDQVATWLPGLEADEIQVGNMVNGPDRERVERDENLTVVGGPLPGAMSIWPNHTQFADKRVLQALVYAVDREAIAESIYGPGQALAYDYTAVDPSASWISPDVPQYSYDPDRARDLLAEAGWDSSRKLDFITYYQSELDQRVVAAMQQYWAEVGVDVGVVHMDGPTFVNRFYEEPDFDLGYGCCGVALPFEYPRYACTNVFPEGYNGSQYCNPEVDEMVDQSLVEPDMETRRELWHTISEITNTELLHLTMFQQDRRHAVSKNVCNYQFRQWTNIVWPARNPEIWYLAE